MALNVEGINVMPLIQVQIVAGRSEEQRRRLVTELTNVMVDVLGSNRERVTVIITEVASQNWGRGGVPMADELAARNGSPEVT